MADPYDFYADIASIAATDTGLTLLLLRSLPVPTNKDGFLASGGEVVSGEAAVAAEIVARIRMSPFFASQLRDLLNRILDRPAEQRTLAAQTSSAEAPAGADAPAHEDASK